MKSRRVVLAGGSGQVGRVLARHFHSLGDSVVVLARKPIDEPCQCTKWDGVTIGPWIEELNNADLVINLAGRSVNCRYNSKTDGKFWNLVLRAQKSSAVPFSKCLTLLACG